MKDSGSFRDPSGYIYKDNGKIYRVINHHYKENFEHLISSGLQKKLLSKNFVVNFKDSDKKINENEYRVLEVEKVFPITYPYEWSFTQLKKAALLTLEIQKISLEFNMTLKDATPYNVQFVGSRAVFIDTLSFEKIKNMNYAWVAYKQFCEMFLAPLCLMRNVDPSLNQLLKTNLDGIPLELVNRLFKFKHKLIPSIFIHLVLPNFIKSNFRNTPTKKKRIISKYQQLNIINQLYGFIEKLEIIKGESEWGEYNAETISEKKDYVDDKEKQIIELLKSNKYELIWDIGSNDGFYSRKLSSLFNCNVMSLDIDWKCVEKNYKINYSKKENFVYPIHLDLSNPSPGIGWDNSERPELFSRIGKPELICLFAIIHHIINKNVPLELIISFLKKTKRDVLIEYVPITDPKCEIIFRSRPKEFKYPSKIDFEVLVSKDFEILKQITLGSTKRVLYYLTKKKND